MSGKLCVLAAVFALILPTNLKADTGFNHFALTANPSTYEDIYFGPMEIGGADVDNVVLAERSLADRGLVTMDGAGRVASLYGAAIDIRAKATPRTSLLIEVARKKKEKKASSRSSSRAKSKASNRTSSRSKPKASSRKEPKKKASSRSSSRAKPKASSRSSSRSKPKASSRKEPKNKAVKKTPVPRRPAKEKSKPREYVEKKAKSAVVRKATEKALDTKAGRKALDKLTKAPKGPVRDPVVKAARSVKAAVRNSKAGKAAAKVARSTTKAVDKVKTRAADVARKGAKLATKTKAGKAVANSKVVKGGSKALKTSKVAKAGAGKVLGVVSLANDIARQGKQTAKLAKDNYNMNKEVLNIRRISKDIDKARTEYRKNPSKANEAKVNRLLKQSGDAQDRYSAAKKTLKSNKIIADGTTLGDVRDVTKAGVNYAKKRLNK